MTLLMVDLQAVIIQLFPEHLVLIIQFILKYQKPLSTVISNNGLVTTLTLKLNAKYSTFVL